MPEITPSRKDTERMRIEDFKLCPLWLGDAQHTDGIAPSKVR